MEVRDPSLISKVTDRDGRCMLCGTTKDLVVHHIIPLVDGGSDTVNNMVTLCEKHHWLYHNWPKDGIFGTKVLIGRGMDKKAKKGYVQYKAPLGYTHRDGKLIVDEEKVGIVRAIFDSYVRERNISKIARHYGLSRMQIYRILRNETYLGKVKWRSQMIDGKHAPIIDPRTFDKVQQLRSSRRSK
jgi:transposase-like protein